MILLVLFPLLEFLKSKTLDPIPLTFFNENTVLPFYENFSSNYKSPLKVSLEYKLL